MKPSPKQALQAPPDRARPRGVCAGAPHRNPAAAPGSPADWGIAAGSPPAEGPCPAGSPPAAGCIGSFLWSEGDTAHLTLVSEHGCRWAGTLPVKPPCWGQGAPDGHHGGSHPCLSQGRRVGHHRRNPEKHPGRRPPFSDLISEQAGTSWDSGTYRRVKSTSEGPRGEGHPSPAARRLPQPP